MANDILELIDTDALVFPGCVVRAGKFNGNRPRLLKLKIKAPEIARMVLRKKSASTKFSKMVIRHDKTLMQLNQLKNLLNLLDAIQMVLS